MPYDEIFSAFYLIVDKDFFTLDKEIAYDYMRQWLHNAVSEPYIRELFSSISLIDEVAEIKYTLKNPSENYPDDLFLKDILSRYLKIAWVTSRVDTAVNLSVVIGGQQEKAVLNNYKANLERLNKLQYDLKKIIKDYNSTTNDYVGGVI